MRNPLKRHPTADAKPTLRERFASMKAKAVGLAAETSQGRRTMLAGSVAAAMPLPALAASAPVASDGRGAYLARLLTAYAEDRACRPISSEAALASIEGTAVNLVMRRCCDVCAEILALPPPKAPDGLALAALAAAIELEANWYEGKDRQFNAGMALIRAVLAITGTSLPPGFVGFGDELNCPEKDDALFAAQGSLPAWAIAEAEAAAKDNA